MQSVCSATAAARTADAQPQIQGWRLPLHWYLPMHHLNGTKTPWRRCKGHGHRTGAGVKGSFCWWKSDLKLQLLTVSAKSAGSAHCTMNPKAVLWCLRWEEPPWICLNYGTSMPPISGFCIHRAQLLLSPWGAGKWEWRWYRPSQ